MKKTNKKIGLTREFLGGMVYTGNIIFNYPKNINNIDNYTIFDEGGLTIILDKEKKKTLGIQVLYRWGDDV